MLGLAHGGNFCGQTSATEGGRPIIRAESTNQTSKGLGSLGLFGVLSMGSLTPKRRVKGKFHYPTVGLFSASLKMKIKIFFLLEIVRNDVKKHKCNYFPFVSILHELAIP